MKCPHCGHEQETGKFCDACGLAISRIKPRPEASGVLIGKLVDADQEKHKCAECGYTFTGRRCGNCGTLYRQTLV